MNTTIDARISREAMEQYEDIRKSGRCNMMDFNCVMHQAREWDYYDLAELADNKSDYLYLLQNYSRLMELYQIGQ